MGNLRFDVVQEAFRKKATKVEKPAGKPSDYFGSLVFGRSNMRRYLDSQTYALWPLPKYREILFIN